MKCKPQSIQRFVISRRTHYTFMYKDTQTFFPVLLRVKIRTFQMTLSNNNREKGCHQGVAVRNILQRHSNSQNYNIFKAESIFDIAKSVL